MKYMDSHSVARAEVAHLIKLLLFAWGGLSILLLGLSFLPSLPYNVEELFTKWPRPLSSALFGLALLLAFVPPVALGWLLVRLRPRSLWIVPAGLVGYGLVSYLAFRQAVPLESIHDLVGSPVLNWPHELERSVRFLALFGWFGLMSIGGATFWVALRSYRLVRFNRWLALALLLWPLAYWGVVEQAATDNLVELLRTGAAGGFGLFLSAWMFLVALGGSGLGARLAGYVSGSLAIFVLLLLTVVGGFLLATLATEPRVFKYDSAFPALSFLLSVDRSHYVVGWELLQRYVIAHLLLVLIMALSQYPAWAHLAFIRERKLHVRYSPTAGGLPKLAERKGSANLSWNSLSSLCRPGYHRFWNMSNHQSNGSHENLWPGWWIWIAVGYLVFVIYGSLVPLEFRPKELGEAWRSFQQIEYLRLGIGSRADWVANILLFIPLAFLWSGVLCRETGNGCVVKGLVIFMLAVLLSLAIEFTQQFFPPRTVSLNDIVAESIGAAIGIFLWWWKGKDVLYWLREIRRSRAPTSLAEYLLWGYLAIVFIYGVLPLDLTISPTEIYHKWKSGRVNLVPFAFPVGTTAEWVYGLATDILIWVPVGLLIVVSKRVSLLRAWLFTVLAAVLLEILQFFVYSRVTDVTDVLTAAVGGMAGAWMGVRFWAKRSDDQVASNKKTVLGCVTWVAAGFLVWSAILLAVFWYPFDFHVDRAFLRSHIEEFFKVPFHAYYYGTEYRAVTELLHKVLFFMPVGGLLSAGWECMEEEPGRFLYRVVGSLVAFSMPFIIELGQVVLPDKLPDSTDLVLELLGIGLGFMIVAHFRRVWRNAASDYTSKP